MPKSILIDPAAVRARGSLSSPKIPVNAYVSKPKVEAEKYGTAALVRMYRDMAVIREFETMLDSIKKEGAYRGVEYQHKGPAHLSIGQEGAVVGQSAALDVEDMIFGSHRSHGEILAKALSSIEKLPEADLLAILEGYMGGHTLRIVEANFPKAVSARDLALTYILYGMLAEIFGREGGFNKGMGGSMHAFFAPFGIMPNNAIVGGSAPIATGAALFKRVQHKPGIVIANIGDASLGCGPVWEAMLFAAMDQYRTLWGDERGGLPILFNFMNNFYGMGGQPVGETMGVGVLARVGLGVNPEAMHAERVDGYNPLAIADATERKKKALLAGAGPVLLDTVTYRFSGHSPSDASSYREQSEIELWKQQDSLLGYGDYLQVNKHATADQLATFHADMTERLTRILKVAIDPQRSPRVNTGVDTIGGFLFNNAYRERMADGVPEVLLPIEKTRLSVTQAKHRFGLDESGNALSKLKSLTYAEALFEAIIQRFYEDPTMVAYGEENRDWGGAFGVYRGLTEALPYRRLFNSPISEAAIVGTAVGYAMSGGRVVAELMYCDFMGRAGDEIFNQMCKWQAMSGGLLTLPMVLRVSVGAKYGAQHSQDWSSIAAHLPGLKVMFPATAYDAKGMLALALRGTDPVIFFESQRLYPEPETVVAGGVPVEYYEVPLGEPATRRAGRDLTILTLGSTLYRALDAAQELQTRHNLSAEVIDLRFLNPLNYEPLIASVRKTGRVLLVSDQCERGSFMHTVASHLAEFCFDDLDAPPAVVGARNWITPPAELEEAFFPQKEWIIDTLHERILPLPGYAPVTVQTAGEMLRRNRMGV